MSSTDKSYRPYVSASGLVWRDDTWASEKTGQPCQYAVGCIVTRAGIVAVYSQWDHTRMTIIARDGRQYDRRWPRGFSQRYLITLADRFAREYA